MTCPHNYSSAAWCPECIAATKQPPPEPVVVGKLADAMSGNTLAASSLGDTVAEYTPSTNRQIWESDFYVRGGGGQSAVSLMDESLKQAMLALLTVAEKKSKQQAELHLSRIVQFNLDAIFDRATRDEYQWASAPCHPKLLIQSQADRLERTTIYENVGQGSLLTAIFPSRFDGRCKFCSAEMVKGMTWSVGLVDTSKDPDDKPRFCCTLCGMWYCGIELGHGRLAIGPTIRGADPRAAFVILSSLLTWPNSLDAGLAQDYGLDLFRQYTQYIRRPLKVWEASL